MSDYLLAAPALLLVRQVRATELRARDQPATVSQLPPVDQFIFRRCPSKIRVALAAGWPSAASVAVTETTTAGAVSETISVADPTKNRVVDRPPDGSVKFFSSLTRRRPVGARSPRTNSIPETPAPPLKFWGARTLPGRRGSDCSLPGSAVTIFTGQEQRERNAIYFLSPAHSR